MSYVLRNKSTNEIASATLINNYKFEYWGAKAWEERDEAEAEAADFLTKHEMIPTDVWGLIEVDESKVKMMNVKLNNDPRRRITMDEHGRLQVIK